MLSGLILSRRVGETIVIDGKVRVTVHKVDGNQVKIRIEAPQDVSIHREEIQMRIDAENSEKHRLA